MTVYHFCCGHDMRGIRSQGITEGQIVGERSYREKRRSKWQNLFIPGWQWVTLDPDRERQSWATNYMIKIDRLEYRWTVEIPEKEEDSLYDREGLSKLYPGTEELFDGWAGSENWRVFRGKIPKYWLTKLEMWNKKSGEWVEVPFRKVDR